MGVDAPSVAKKSPYIKPYDIQTIILSPVNELSETLPVCDISHGKIIILKWKNCNILLAGILINV